MLLLYCMMFCMFTIGLRSVVFALLLYFFFFKQKTAYEMRISDWSSDVCSSDLAFAKKHLQLQPVADLAQGLKRIVAGNGDYLLHERYSAVAAAEDRKSVV